MIPEIPARISILNSTLGFNGHSLVSFLTLPCLFGHNPILSSASHLLACSFVLLFFCSSVVPVVAVVFEGEVRTTVFFFNLPLLFFVCIALSTCVLFCCCSRGCSCLVCRFDPLRLSPSFFLSFFSSSQTFNQSTRAHCFCCFCLFFSFRFFLSFVCSRCTPQDPPNQQSPASQQVAGKSAAAKQRSKEIQRREAEQTRLF